jgi:hypothetical protein
LRRLWHDQGMPVASDHAPKCEENGRTVPKSVPETVPGGRQ